MNEEEIIRKVDELKIEIIDVLRTESKNIQDTIEFFVFLFLTITMCRLLIWILF